MTYIKRNIKQIISFGTIGVINTIVGTTVMFLLYNLVNAGYWISSAANYVVGSICSYLLNKRFTFKVKETSIGQIIKFIINILICYLLAYGIAQKLVYLLLKDRDISTKAIGNIAMVIGMMLFVSLNFLGQKFFVFKKKDETSK